MRTWSESYSDIESGPNFAEPTGVFVLRSDSYKIGSSVEFDYSCVGVARTVQGNARGPS